MIGNIGVDISVIIATAEEVRADNSKMKTKLGAVSDGVAALKSSWQSDASASLSTISSKMSAKFEDLEKSVESFAKFLDTVASNYEKTEASNVSQTKSIESMFN